MMKISHCRISCNDAFTDQRKKHFAERSKHLVSHAFRWNGFCFHLPPHLVVRCICKLGAFEDEILWFSLYNDDRSNSVSLCFMSMFHKAPSSDEMWGNCPGARVDIFDPWFDFENIFHCCNFEHAMTSRRVHGVPQLFSVPRRIFPITFMLLTKYFQRQRVMNLNTRKICLPQVKKWFMDRDVVVDPIHCSKAKRQDFAIKTNWV